MIKDRKMIIDAHVHLPVIDGCGTLQQKRERLLQEMSMNQVDKCILISDSCMESSIGSMDECVELFERIDSVYVVGGISPFFEFQTQLIKLKQYLDKKKIVGIKLFTGHEAFYLTDAAIKEVYELAIHYDVPVLFHSGWDDSQYGDVSLAVEIAKKYPELKLVCCHCFYPEIEKCMLLVDLQNVFFDLSSVADDLNSITEMSEKLKKIINAAPTRVLFGSDYSCCSQREHIEFVKGLKLERSIENDIFGKNAEKVYSLG